jgi:MoaA/NifB/PqqE/SkfB family radical SAM enzyme
VTFSGGGEPFCYPHLLEVAEMLTRGSVKFASLTNGSLLRGDVAEIFARHATWVRVSMDGWDDATYTEYRNCGKGEFTRIISNMKNFKKISEKCYLGVSLIVDRKNAGHIYDFIRMIKDIGVNSVKVSPCVVSNSGKENNRYHTPIFDRVKELIHKSIEEFQDRRFEIFDSYHTLDDKFAKEYTWCPYLQILPVIGADCNIYSCQDKAYNLAEGLIGSIKGQRFKEFWLSDKKKFFAINPAKACNHHCVSNGKNRLINEYLESDPEHLEFV